MPACCSWPKKSWSSDVSACSTRDSGTSPSTRSRSPTMMLFSLMRGISELFCISSDSLMRSRMSSTDSKPIFSLAHSSVTSGVTFFFTTLQVTSKVTGLPA